MPITINPNQPDPVVLASDLLPPPVWPLPVGDWVVLPPVAEGFPTGPFLPEPEGPVQIGAPRGARPLPLSAEATAEEMTVTAEEPAPTRRPRRITQQEKPTETGL